MHSTVWSQLLTTFIYSTMIRKNRWIVLFWLLLFCFVWGHFMVRMVRSRRLGNQRFFRLCPCLLNTLSGIYMFIWLNWSSKIYPGLAELGQQMCDTSLEQGLCFSCSGSEGQHVSVEHWEGMLVTCKWASPRALGWCLGSSCVKEPVFRRSIFSFLTDT